MGTEVLLTLARTLALPSIGQANLSPSRYALIEFPVPPIPEQQQIVEHLVQQTTRINEIRNQVTKSIQQLSEYRGALITSAVTGRLEGIQ